MQSAYDSPDDTVNWTADAAYSAGDIIQLPDGSAGQVTLDVVSGDAVGVRVRGILFNVAKTSGFNALAGNRAYWDVSASKVNYKKVNDRDFYVGRFAEDGTGDGTDTTCSLRLNVDPKPDVDLLRDGYLSVPTGTQAAGSTGFSLPKDFGGSKQLLLTATSEAQCIDMLSVDRFSVDANPIAEFIVRPAANGSDSTVDFNMGLASATSTSDADAIAESVFAHIDGGSTAIATESDDGTTEVAADATGSTISAGTAVANRTEFWIDARDKANVKVYVDGARKNSDVTHVLTAATGPLALLVHLEKSTGTATANFIVDRAVVRFQK
jgi:predicted RecA/RadA family phage recombinase